MADLVELQSLTKKDPELYREEVLGIYEEFNELMTEFYEQPSASHPRLTEIIKFLSQVCLYFTQEMSLFPGKIVKILDSYYQTLFVEFRKIVFGAIKLLRNRDQIRSIDIIPVLFKLFRVKDKHLRQETLGFIVADIKRGKCKETQNFIYSMVADNNITAAKKSLHVLMTLHKKQVWTDPRTVNVIAGACLTKSPKLVIASALFLLSSDTAELESDSESDVEIPDKAIIGAKKSDGNKAAKERAVAQAQKKGRRREKRRLIAQKKIRFLCIDQLYDVSDYSLRLMKNIRENFAKGHFAARIAMLHLLARVVSRHKLIVLEMYTFLMRYLNPSIREVTQLLTVAAESCHERIPGEELAPMVRKIMDNFVSEHCNEDTIVLGINTIREIATRQPETLDADTLQDLTGYKTYRNKGVVMAAKSLINLYRQINPSLLNRKDRSNIAAQLGEEMKQGVDFVHESVPGAKFLDKSTKAIREENIEPIETYARSMNLDRVREIKAKRAEEDPEQEEEEEEMEVEEESEEEEQDAEAEPEGPTAPVDTTRFITQGEFNKIRQLQSEIIGKKRKADKSIDMLMEELEAEEAEAPSSDEGEGEFIQPDSINTIKKTRREKIMEQREHKARRKSKGGGKTHKENRSNKPAIHKIMKRQQSLQSQLTTVSKQMRKVKHAKQFKGHFNKRTGQFGSGGK